MFIILAIARLSSFALAIFADVGDRRAGDFEQPPIIEIRVISNGRDAFAERCQVVLP